MALGVAVGAVTARLLLRNIHYRFLLSAPIIALVGGLVTHGLVLLKDVSLPSSQSHESRCRTHSSCLSTQKRPVIRSFASVGGPLALPMMITWSPCTLCSSISDQSHFKMASLSAG
jgi:hypothetical protein